MATVDENCCVVGDEECDIIPSNRPQKRKISVTKCVEIKTRLEEKKNILITWGSL
jgi:hypothetical protein